LVLATATLANTSQVFTFPPAGREQHRHLADHRLPGGSLGLHLGIDRNCYAAVPHRPAPIAATPTNSANGLLTGIRGKVSALGTNQFTLTTPRAFR